MAVVTVVAAVAVVVAAVVTAARGEDLRNVIITGFGEMPYEPAPGWRAGGYFQSDVFPVDVNNDDGLPQTMDVALRTRILVEDPNEKKTSSDGTENNSAEDGVKSSSRLSEKNTLDKDKAKEIEEELLSTRTRWGLSKLKAQRDTKETSTTPPAAAAQSSIPISQYRQAKTYNPPYYPPGSDGYNNREYFGDLGEGWSLQDAEEILGGRNYNVLTQNPNGYYPKNYPPPLPPPREIPPPRFPPNSFYPFPSFGYKPFPPPPRTGRSGHSPREEVVYGLPADSAYQPSRRWDYQVPRVYPYYDDYLSGA